MSRRNKAGRTIAIVGGGALLLLLLLRGKGWGLGAGSGSGDGNARSESQGEPSHRRCDVFIDADGIELDGAPADLATVTARCRATGEADVRATGAAITGVVAEVIHALQDAGVRVWTSAGVWDTARTMPRGRRA